MAPSAAPAATPAADSRPQVIKTFENCLGELNLGNANPTRYDELAKSCWAPQFQAEQIDGDKLAAPALVERVKGLGAAKVKTTLGGEVQTLVLNGNQLFALIYWKATTLEKPSHEFSVLDLERVQFDADGKMVALTEYGDPGARAAQLAGGHDGERGPVYYNGRWPNAIASYDSAAGCHDCKEAASLALAERWAAAWNAHDGSALGSLLADDVMLADQTRAKDDNGHAEVVRAYEATFAAFPDAKLESPSFVAAGDYVVALGTFTGRATSGKRASVHYADLLQVGGGKVIRIWHFHNREALANQLAR
jgi:ketosteroid isomerase-like protein